MSQLINSFKMVVSEKEGGKYVPRGEVEVFYPILADLNISGEVKEKSDEGFPVYADDLHQYVFDGVLAAVKAAARNKLEVVNGKVRLKDGLSIASTTEQLLESGGNNGAALAAIREFLTAAKDFLTKTGKSQAVQAAILGFFNKPDTIALVEDAAKREKIRGYLLDFMQTATAEQAGKWARRAEVINAACDAACALDDADF